MSVAQTLALIEMKQEGRILGFPQSFVDHNGPTYSEMVWGEVKLEQ
jgi:hypothetical protein